MKNRLQRLFSHLILLKEFLKTDVKIIKKVIFDQWIDTLIWVSTTVLVAAYILPNFGISSTYGTFMLAGICASIGAFQAFPCVAGLIADFEGDYITGYYLTLPCASWVVFLRKVLHYAILSFFLGILILPMGKLFLWNLFSLSQVNVVKYFLILVSSTFFYGALGVWTTSFVPDSSRLGIVWSRLIYPMWFLGCFQFSWRSLYDWSPALAYLDLINPITYVAEGHRAAILGQESGINFWICILAITLFSVIGMIHAISRLKKRLDFI